MSEDKNPREELYQRFRQSLARPVADRYFDEDELVEIYDYAGDISDDYVQMEALFCGARLYPESVSLSERRALLYLDTSIDDSDTPSPAAGEYLDDNVDTVSPIFDIARLEVNRPDDAEAAVEFVLNQYDFFGDEEIIRLLDLAFNLDMYKWVVANLDRLRAKVRFQPVLLYEMMQEADEMNDNDLMAAMAEELIETEPFAVNYWIMLFKAQARAGKEDEARSTFDYAKALGTDDPDSLLALAETAYNHAPYLYKETFDILEGLKAERPDEFVYTDCQCALLVRSEGTAKAIAMLKEYLDRHPGHQKAMRQLLLCNVPEAEIYLRRFYDATDGRGFDSDIYADLVTTLSTSNSSRSLAALMEVSTGGGTVVSPIDFCTWVESLFSLGRYTELVELIEAYSRKEDGEEYLSVISRIPLKGCALSFAYMVSLMKLGRQAEAEAHFTQVRPVLEMMITECPMPLRMSVRCLFTLADKIRRHPAEETLYWEYFDMLNFGKF